MGLHPCDESKRIDRMGATLRSLAVALLGLAFLAAAAPAATVDRDTETGVITIIDDVATADDIRIERTATFDIVSRAGGGLTNNSGQCTQTAAAEPVLCPRGTSVAVDLGAGNDRFRADAIDDTISVAGGAGDDDIGTSDGPDVLAGGPGDDQLLGGGGSDRLAGGDGNDVVAGGAGNDAVSVRDGRGDRVSCGPGTDRITSRDSFDAISRDCERR
jgi:Ca2+-binding RTX toxin-like protein